MHDVFISYSTQDQNVAEEVVTFLENNGVECWIAPRNIKSGKSYSEEIVTGLKEAKLVVLIFSKNSQDSNYVNNEIELAFSYDKPIIAFKISESLPKNKLEFYLKNSQWLEASDNPKKHYLELLNDSNVIIDEQNKHDVYICYDYEDKKTADAICHALEENNIRCWIRPRDLSVKHETEETMEAIKESKLIVLVYSNYSKNSNFIKNEIDLAFSYNLPIFAFNIDNSKLDGSLEFFLKGQHWLDAYPNPSNEFKNLIVDVSTILGKKIPHELNKENNTLNDNKNKENKSKSLFKYKKLIMAGGLIILFILAGLLFLNISSNPTIYVSEITYNNESAYYTVWGTINDLPIISNGYFIKTEFYDSSNNILDEYNQEVTSISNEVNGEKILGISDSLVKNVTKIKLTLYDSKNQNIYEVEKNVTDVAIR